MYNAEFKQRFLDESDNKESTCLCIKHEFDRIEEYEKLINKDCSNFTLNDIISYYKLIASSSAKTLTVINSYFKSYTSFAIRNNFVTEGINHYDEITAVIIKNCINSGRLSNKIFTRDELYTFVDTLDCVVSEQVILLAAFEGIEVDELIDIQLKDFDNGKVKLNSGREIPVSSKLIGLSELAANEYEYTDDTNKTYKFDVNDPGVIKVRVRKDTDISKLRVAKKNRVSKFMYNMTHKTNIPLTYTSLKESGRIDFIKSIITEDESLYNSILRNRDVINYRYPSIKNVKSYIIEYGDYIK